VQPADDATEAAAAAAAGARRSLPYGRLAQLTADAESKA